MTVVTALGASRLSGRAAVPAFRICRPALVLDTEPVIQFGRFAAHAATLVSEHALLGSSRQVESRAAAGSKRVGERVAGLDPRAREVCHGR